MRNAISLCIKKPEPRKQFWFFYRRLIDQRSTISDQRSTINDQRSTISDQRSTINDQRSTISDQRSTINDQRSTIIGAVRFAAVYKLLTMP
ncbi:hypothetical protein RGU70_14715 [Herbaspirillum sp. RTI4]|uniref:hypothetical protein n=1 Tax=Herbaspirillum sp. RTI4 TaxID=3048640 RepID=UPI002AB5AD05|nr:hypothetical protein [Herbaspirillum sp. RTI4]MDY7579566.1 hypothetical protein [Herbaspirillum sp. RTI4]